MVDFSDNQLQQLRGLFDNLLDPIKNSIQSLETRMERMETRMERMETKMERMETKIESIDNNILIITAKQKNSTAGRDDNLSLVPNINGMVPDLDFPSSINAILVAGNEVLPNGIRNDWNKMKSIALLQFYGENDDTDNEDEYSVTSRARRLRLAKAIGVTQTQLNFAQLTL